MDLVRSSWAFHRDLERPRAFLAREWRIIAVTTAAYVALTLIILMNVDPAFFYTRIETDSLLYLLKARSLVENGHTQAVSAVNAAPFPYAAMPGVLRAPLVYAFHEFDHQLRAIQVANVLVIASTALMSGYIVSWVLPRRLHPIAVVAPFIFVLLSPDWLANTYAPLADAPFAFLTLACFLIAVSVTTSPSGLLTHKAAIAFFVVLAAIAFMVRFIAPTLFVAVALLARGRPARGPSISPRSRTIALSAFAVGLLLLIALNANTIVGKYLLEPVWYLTEADKTGMGLNLLGSAIPSQIVPVFNIGFSVKPTSVPLDPIFGSTLRDALWTVAGILISAVTALGLARSVSRLLPEIAYFLVTLPVLAAMIPSTTRYLLPFQPFLWMMFIVGARELLEPWKRYLHGTRGRIVATGAVACLVGAIVLMRASRTSRTAGDGGGGSVIERTERYTGDVASTFRSLRQFLESLPADRTLLLSTGGEVGRWYIIAGRHSYAPDSLLPQAVSKMDVYAVYSCGSRTACRNFGDRHKLAAKRLSRFGRFQYPLVFEKTTPHARAAVRRVVAAGDSVVHSASGLASR